MVRTQKPRYPPPPLYPAEHADIPAMVDLWFRANEPDLLRRILNSNEAARREGCRQFLSETISGADSMVMKAVDWEDESVVTAFGMWRKVFPAKEGERGFDDKGINPGTRELPIDGVVKDTKDEEKKTPLQEYLAAQTEAIHKTWTKDVRHVELMVLMTDPAYQRRGIGTALVKWGHELAAEDNLPSFLESSPFGFPLYRSLGWNVIAEVQIDLKEWVEFAGDGDMGWGSYKSRFMLRLPRVGDV